MRRSQNLPIYAALGAIAFWTLLPSANRQPEPFALCLICGSRGAADAVLNLLLFVPLGLAIGRRSSWVSALGIGFLASAFVELCQTVIPGREPTAGDLVFNSLGTLGGFFLLRIISGGVSYRPRTSLPGFSAALLAALLILAGLLRAPLLPESTYYGQWTPELGRSRPYPGRLLTVEVGGLSIPNRRLDDSGAIRAAFLAGSPLQMLAVADRASGRTRLLFSIHDDVEREIVSLAVEGDDLLASYGSRLELLRLEPAVARFPDLLADVEPGDTFAVSFSIAERSATVSVGETVREGVRHYSPGESWRLLIGGGGSRNLAGALISVLWLVGLTAPIGYLGKSRVHILGAAGVVWVAMAVAYLSGFHDLPAAEVLAPAVGALLGRLISRRMGRIFAHGAEAQSAGASVPLRRRSAPRSSAASG